MRTRERLEGLREWVYETVCQGRQMKSPGKSGKIADAFYKEPECFVGWEPAHKDSRGLVIAEGSLAPCVLIMPKPGYVKNMEEQRYDSYNHIKRPQEMGQTLPVDILFCVYEPGIRLPGFTESAERKEGPDMSLLLEGTRQGLYTLTDWMDDLMEKLIGGRIIPGTDLLLNDAKAAYSLYTDQSYVVDKRPLYYGFITCEFNGHANESVNPKLKDILG